MTRRSTPRSGAARRPSRSRRSRRSRRPLWRRLLVPLLWLLVVLGLLGAVLVGYAYARTDIPDPNAFAESQSSILYYADGETELARFTGGYNRESVSLDRVPGHVEQAMLAAEDRDFYENRGVSVTGTLRALWHNLTSETIQGGSTITQQYVKNYFLSQEQTYARKFEEALIAVKIDQRLSKDEILESYLNTIYYGRGAYGVQTAAQAYYGKDVEDLTLAEGAFLAGVTNAPALFDPHAGDNEQRAQDRFRYVVDGMAEQGWLAPGEAESVSFPEIQPPEPTSATTGVKGYIATSVRQELIDTLGITDADVDQGGLRVVTTIEQQHQDAAEQAVERMVPEEARHEELRVGLVAVRPGDGAITALYGGQDYSERQISNATDAQLQAGSLMKPVTLAAGLEAGFSTLTEYPGPSPMEFDIEGQAEPYEVQNFRDEQFGLIDLRTATAESVNTVYVQHNQQVGPERTRDMAVRLGLPEDTPGLDAELSNVLGPAAPTVAEMAGAYATIASRGERADTYLVQRVTSTNGQIDHRAEPEAERVLEADVTADVTDAMAQVITQGTGVLAGDLGRPAAGKSGTSESNRSAWFSGFVPQLVATVGMYQGDGTVEMEDVAGQGRVTGGTFPVQVWGEFLRLAMEGEPVEPLPERVGIGDDDLVTPEPTPTPEETEPTVEEEPTETEVEPSPTETGEPTETDTEPSPTETDEPSPTSPAEPTETDQPTQTDVEPTQPNPTVPPEPTDQETGSGDGDGEGEGDGEGDGDVGGADEGDAGLQPPVEPTETPSG